MPSVLKPCLAATLVVLAIAAGPVMASTGSTNQPAFDLYKIIFWWCVAIGVIVVGTLLYAIIKHRSLQQQKTLQPSQSNRTKIRWAVIPLVMLIILGVPAISALFTRSDNSEGLTIKVTGSQWKWHYEYLEYEGNTNLDLDFLSVPLSEYQDIEVDNPLVIPTGKKIRFLITSDDVIHTWWIPDFAMKKDAVPGFTNELSTIVPNHKPGIYRGKAGELCGADHPYMPIVVDVRSPEEFEEWLVTARKAKNNAKSTTKVKIKTNDQ